MAIKKRCKCGYRNRMRAKRCAKCGRVLRDFTWVVDVHFRNGPRVVRKAASLEEARKIERKIKGEDGDDKRNGEVQTLGDFWPLYIAQMKGVNRETEIEHKQSRWELHLKPFFGQKLLDEITRLDAEVYRSKRLQEGASPATVNREIALLRHMLNKAVEWGLIERNQEAEIKMLQEDSKGRFISKDDLRKITENISDNYRDLLVFLVMTGIRLGEALALEWKQIDLERGVMVIYGYQTKRKTTFVVPLHAEVVKLLRKRRGKIKDEKVFRHSKINFIRAFKQALKRAGLDPSIRVHDLRHTFITRLLAKGAIPPKVAALVGHKRLETTMRYAHLTPEILADTVRLIDVI